MGDPQVMPVSSRMSGASREASDLACPVCGGSERVLLLMARDHHYGNSGDFRLEGCTHCGLGVQAPMPSEAELARFYPDDYPCHQWVGVDRPWLVRLRRWLLCDTLAREPRIERPGRMLDVGCGSGVALVRFRRLGWEAIGVEPDPRAVRTGREHGLEIIEGRLEGAGFAEASFDYVRLDHSFEHLRDPLGTLRELRRILRPGGRLFVSVPEFGSTTRRWWGGYWWFLGLPVHTYQYSHRTLPRLLQKEGFEVESVRVRPHLGGTLGSLEIYLNRERGRGAARIDLVGSSILRTLGQWSAALISILGTGEVLDVTVVRPRDGGNP